MTIAAVAKRGTTANPAGGDGWPPLDLAAYRGHLASVLHLCEQVGRPFDEVTEVYQCELLRLLAQASVADYLPVLVAKRVRQLYQHRVQARAAGAPCAQLLGSP
ncbi:MAG: DUF3562 domain-containing protein [Telluria sp.]